MVKQQLIYRPDVFNQLIHRVLSKYVRIDLFFVNQDHSIDCVKNQIQLMIFQIVIARYANYVFPPIILTFSQQQFEKKIKNKNKCNIIVLLKYIKMDRSQNLQKQRFTRLRTIRTVLGQPDLLTIVKATTINTFLSQKKQFEKQEKFVFGLNFPTTAHFSSYMNDRIKSGKKIGKVEIQYKIKLCMYDIFKKIDFHIEINIPGSLEMKAYNLHGGSIHLNSQSYQSAYYSSVLRSLYPYCYHPHTQIHGEVQIYQVMTQFINSFIPFTFKNEIECNDQSISQQNIGVELVINYLKQYSFWNLSNNLLLQLKKHDPERSILFGLQLKQLKGQYKQAIVQCAEYLMKNNNSMEFNTKLIQFQVRSLCKIKKKGQAKFLSQNLIRRGLESLQTWEQILKMYFQQNHDKYFFKLLNTATTFCGEETTLKQKLQKLIYPPHLSSYRQFDQKYTLNPEIIHYPQFMFKFDNKFLDNQIKFKRLKELLQKTQKEKPTAQMIHRMEMSYNKQTFFQKFTALFEKQKGWNRLLQIRADCFWLENDYANYETLIKKKSNQMSYRFMNDSFSDLDRSSHPRMQQLDRSQEKSQEKDRNNRQRSGQRERERERQRQTQNSDDQDAPEGMDESFQGQFSDNQSQNQSQINVVAPCSKRVATKRVSRQLGTKKVQFSKILCNYNLQKMFLTAYNNLKLHTDVQKWAIKLDFKSLGELSKQKKQLIAFVFVKKGILHKNMLRYRKSEESFKIARKCVVQPILGLISSYSLAKLYLQHNNIKGVQYYTVEIVKILYELGIKKYQAVPQWAKQIIPFIIKNYGKNINKRLQGPLRQLVDLWLRIDNK